VAVQEQKSKTIELVIVYGVNKDLGVTEDETILEVKKGALGVFDIDESEIDHYILRAKVQGDKDEQLDEARTVASYKLHNKQKVTLTAGTPFGSR
jgi:hypothetical protein